MITVVIVNHNRARDLREAVCSAAQQTVSDREIIVVDNASTDASQSVISEAFPDVRWIPLEENIGMDGYSVGFRHARGELVFQMDNDSLMPDSGVLAAVEDRFERGPKELAVVATRVEEYRNGLDQVATLRERDVRRGPIDTGGFHAGGVGFKKDLLDTVGYYNRDVFLYGSELFLQMNLLAKGYKIFFYPEILMLHKSSPAARSRRSLYYEVRNRYWFMRRFATPAARFRHLPSMVLHDLLYSIGRGQPREFARALRHGLGKMPESLAHPLVSTQPRFVEKVHELGSTFSVEATVKRVIDTFGRRRRETS